MNVSSSELKRRARQALVGKYGTMVGAGLLICALSGGLSLLLTLFVNGSLAYQISFLIINILTAILAAGFFGLTLNIARGRDAQAIDVFAVFSSHPDRIIILTLLLMLVSTVCLIPISIPAFLIALSVTGLSIPETSLILFTLLACIISAIFLVLVSLRYSLVYFLYFDHPDLSATELMRESARRMQGRKGRYFCLHISFLGMYLLGILTLGLGYLWIVPYVSMTQAFFYLEACGEPHEYL